jgi:hypothetical protein
MSGRGKRHASDGPVHHPTHTHESGTQLPNVTGVRERKPGSLAARPALAPLTTRRAKRVRQVWPTSPTSANRPPGRSHPPHRAALQTPRPKVRARPGPDLRLAHPHQSVERKPRHERRRATTLAAPHRRHDATNGWCSTAWWKSPAKVPRGSLPWKSRGTSLWQLTGPLADRDCRVASSPRQTKNPCRSMIGRGRIRGNPWFVAGREIAAADRLRPSPECLSAPGP